MSILPQATDFMTMNMPLLGGREKKYMPVPEKQAFDEDEDEEDY